MSDGEARVEGDGAQKRSESRRGWVAIVLAALVAVGAALLACHLLERHQRDQRALRLELEEKRAAATREREEQRLVTGAVQAYLAAPWTEWHRRDAALALVEARAKDKPLREWARDQRQALVPYLRRIRLVGRYNEEADRIALVPVADAPPIPASRPTGGPAPAQRTEEEDKALAKAKGTPAWRALMRTRERLRLRPGKYCCAISTGSDLFSRASSVGACRQQAQALCTELARTLGKPQKCGYSLASECAGGEIIAAGDVSSAE